jgi:hypothetical protein
VAVLVRCPASVDPALLIDLAGGELRAQAHRFAAGLREGADETDNDRLRLRGAGKPEPDED